MGPSKIICIIFCCKLFYRHVYNEKFAKSISGNFIKKIVANNVKGTYISVLWAFLLQISELISS